MIARSVNRCSMMAARFLETSRRLHRARVRSMLSHVFVGPRRAVAHSTVLIGGRTLVKQVGSDGKSAWSDYRKPVRLSGDVPSGGIRPDSVPRKVERRMV
jgi:hypothetical protein